MSKALCIGHGTGGRAAVPTRVRPEPVSRSVRRAFERYGYRSTDTPRAGGAPVQDTGWGLVVYHHDADGRWRVARDAFATDRPLPTR